MLIKNAECLGRGRADIRISGGLVSEIAPNLPEQRGEEIIEAEGGLILPGLRDHHLHLYAAAAALNSVNCGPPYVTGPSDLGHTITTALARAKDAPWIRGIGYHESVAGTLDRQTLDRLSPAVPLRIQHRTGRLWVFNTAGLRTLGVFENSMDDPFERAGGQLTGRLYDGDEWLKVRANQGPPSVAALSRMLASWGVVGVTDAGPHNDLGTLTDLALAHARGELLQDVRVMGNETLDQPPHFDGVKAGELKFHLHEHDLPPFDQVCAAIQRSRGYGRRAAFHCTTRTELFFALGALEEATPLPGDRIEHASVTPDDALPIIKRLGVRVVTQPCFVATRGDSYMRDVDADDQPWLYRLSGFLSAGIPLAAASDAPFGSLSPWQAMQTAVTRKTYNGALLGPQEAITPEQALQLFTSDLERPGDPESIHAGGRADLCLLSMPWRDAREALDAVTVRATLSGGRGIYDSQV
jgi:predicted amidohydrolase YtcJ